MNFSTTKRECGYKYADRIHSMKCIEVAWGMIKDCEIGDYKRIIYILDVGGGVKHRVLWGFCDHIRLQMLLTSLFNTPRSPVLKSRDDKPVL